MSHDRGPIFIGGLAHSGKTPLRIILGAHPDLSMTRRTYLWNRFYGSFGDLRDRANLDRCLTTMVQDDHARQLEPDAERIRREFLEGSPSYARLFALFHQHHAERRGKRRWGDQLGSIERFADVIFSAFPSARMIHMIRDPRAWHSAGNENGSSRKGKLGWDTAMWLHSAELAERNSRRYPEKYRVVRYEALATRCVDVVEEVCAFLNEDFVPPMASALTTMSVDCVDAAHPGQRVPSSSCHPRGQMSFVDMYAGRELAALGYERMEPSLTPRQWLTFRLVDWPLNRAAMAAWRAARRRPLARQAKG
jgi:hypothetical protein